MEEIIKLLNEKNNEAELFEALLIATLEPKNPIIKETALAIAARIQAGRDIRFDLKKVIKENDNSRLRNEVSGKEKSEK